MTQKTWCNDLQLYKEIFFVISAELIGLLVAVGMMLSIGRRLSMTAAGVILVVIEIIDQCTIITTPMFITTIGLSASFAVIQMYTEEVYPAQSHSAGVGIATAAGRFGSLALPLAAAAMTDGKHKTPAIVLFAIKILLSGVCALHLPVEAE
ncbi:organic cation/carnitine transporter 7 [Tanacetum coccineum]